MLGEDLENHLGAIEHPGLQVELEVPLLTGAEILVADDHVETAFELHLAQLFALAHADEMPGIDLAAALHIRSDDLGACGACQIGQLAHLLAYELLGGAW